MDFWEEEQQAGGGLVFTEFLFVEVAMFGILTRTSRTRKPLARRTTTLCLKRLGIPLAPRAPEPATCAERESLTWHFVCYHSTLLFS